MSVVVMLGAGALIGLVALTAIIMVALLTEKPEPGPEPDAEDASARAREPERTAAGTRP